MKDDKITVLGGGSFGTTLANIVAETFLRDSNYRIEVVSDLAEAFLVSIAQRHSMELRFGLSGWIESG